MKSVSQLLMSIPRFPTVVQRLERVILTALGRRAAPARAARERGSEAGEPPEPSQANLVNEPNEQPGVGAESSAWPAEPTAWPSARPRLNSDHYDAVAPESLGQEWLLRATDSTAYSRPQNDEELLDSESMHVEFQYDGTDLDLESAAVSPDRTRSYRTDTDEVVRDEPDSLK